MTLHVRKHLPCQKQNANRFPGVCFFPLHPGKLTWNLKITCLKRKIIFQTSIFGFHVNFQGCILTCRIYKKGFGVMKLLENPGHLRSPRPSSKFGSRGDSFHTIASVGSNSAVVHYQPEKGTCKSLTGQDILLIDAWCSSKKKIFVNKKTCVFFFFSGMP